MGLDRAKGIGEPPIEGLELLLVPCQPGAKRRRVREGFLEGHSQVADLRYDTVVTGGHFLFLEEQVVDEALDGRFEALDPPDALVNCDLGRVIRNAII